MSDCACTLPAECWPQGAWHLRVNERGNVVAYERCPASYSPLHVRLVRAGVPEQYRGYTRRAWAGEWPAEAQAFVVDPTGNLFIFGSNGTGKTFLATAILGELMERGIDGAWCSAKDLPELNPDRSDRDRELEERYRSVRVLVMDDLFSEQTFKAERVRNTVDRRYRASLPTIYTSMVEPTRALQIDSDMASRVASGLRIERRGADWRIVKQKTA